MLDNINMLAQIQQSEGGVDNTRWRAPETMSGNLEDLETNTYSLAADIYAWALTSAYVRNLQVLFMTFRLTFIQIVTQAVPFVNVRPVNLVRAIQRGVPFSETSITELRDFGLFDLLSSCWTLDHTARPSIEEVLVELKKIRHSITREASITPLPESIH